MILKMTEYLSVEDKYFDQIALNNSTQNRLNYILSDDRYSIYLNGKKYNCYSDSYIVRHPGTDEKYHLIYIQINYKSNEYYIGKVNRKKFRELQRYPGSGIRFINSYKKHKNEFARFYIAICNTDEETERLEREIVNKELLKDEFILNLVEGGGGNSHSSSEERNEKIKKYMIEHPENYKAMMDAAHKLFTPGSFELKKRNEKIRIAHSDEKHRQAMSKRIKNWRNDNPEAYEIARKNNAKSTNKKETIEKKSKSYFAFKENNPELFAENEKKRIAACKTESSRRNHSEAQKRFAEQNPEKAAINTRKRVQGSIEACSKKCRAKDLKTGEVIKEFNSIKDAARWLTEMGFTKCVNPSNSIIKICRKEPIPGHGTPKSAYGFDWEYVD